MDIWYVANEMSNETQSIFMKNKEFWVNFSLLIFGLFLLSLSANLSNSAWLGSHGFARVIEILGIAIIGHYLISTLDLVRKKFLYTRNMKQADKDFDSSKLLIKISDSDNEYSFIGASVDGCITPSDRGSINLRKLAKLRAYFDYKRIHTDMDIPGLIICTGRSQGYIEFLCQSMGIASECEDIPFVIENGAAIYYPVKKQTMCLLEKKQRQILESARELLQTELDSNSFEPKSFMITVNPQPETQTISQLSQKVTLLLRDHKMINELSIHTSNTSVDINVRGILKRDAFRRAVREINTRSGHVNLQSVIYIAESSTDIEIIKDTGISYCSDYDVPNEIKQYIGEKHGKQNIVNKKDIDLFLYVLEKHTGLESS